MYVKTLAAVLLLFPVFLFSQTPLFKVYSDSAKLVQDAKIITNDFMQQVYKTDESLKVIKPTAVLNTTPYLIFWDDSSQTANMPIWQQVIPQQKQFFIQLNQNNEAEGLRMFGLFFNGFYLPHELSHAVEWHLVFHSKKRKSQGYYMSEYFANTLAIIYWRKSGRTAELEACYKFAKQMVAQLPNPVPAGEDKIAYFNNNYERMTSNPFAYGYYQFSQFVEIYEKKELPSFEAYLGSFTK